MGKEKTTSKSYFAGCFLLAIELWFNSTGHRTGEFHEDSKNQHDYHLGSSRRGIPYSCCYTNCYATHYEAHSDETHNNDETHHGYETYDRHETHHDDEASKTNGIKVNISKKPNLHDKA